MHLDLKMTMKGGLVGAIRVGRFYVGLEFDDLPHMYSSLLPCLYLINDKRTMLFDFSIHSATVRLASHDDVHNGGCVSEKN